MKNFKKIAFVGTLAVAFILAGANAAKAYVHTVTLKMGSTGTQVMELQKALNAAGFTVSTTGAGSPGMESTYFGTKTSAAVKSFQASKGVKADGIVGPTTGALLATVGTTTGTGTGTGTAGCPAGAMYNYMTGALCTTTGGTTTLEGTDGTINDVNELSQYNNEEVAEGSNDVKVAGFEVEASNDGDIQITSAKITVTVSNGSGSDNLDDYVDTVSVMMGDEVVGSADSSDFSEGSAGVWSKTISLTDSVVNADDTEKFYIAFDAANNLDSGDIDSETVTVDLTNLRYKDGSGVTTTDDSTGDISSIGVGVSFVDFGTAADTELKLSVDSDSPDAGIVMIDDSSNTDGVVLLKGKITLDGTSDVLMDEFPVTLTTVGGANVAAVVNTLNLEIGGDEYSESVTITGATTGTVTFDNLDFNIDAGDVVDFTVTGDINDIDAGNLDEGDTLTASVTSTNRDYIDAENEDGDQLSDSTEKSGTVTGDAQEFRTSGISLSLVSTSTSITSGTSANDDLGTFTIKFKVTAVGDTVYVSSLTSATLTGVTTGKTSVHADRSGTATVGGTSVTMINTTDTDLNGAGLYQIDEGETNTFELTTTMQLPTAGSAGQFRVALGGVSWDTDSTDDTPDNAYTSNLDSFVTSYIGLN